MNEGQLTLPESKRLRELLENEHGSKRDGVTLAGILTEHPELLAGVDEYVAYSEQRAKQIGRTDEKPSVGHPTSDTLSAVLASAKGKPA